jgi:tetratricopeptide (TPR) repeat protein
MVKRRYGVILVGLLAVILSACTNDPGIRERYDLEKKMWRARMIENRIWSRSLSISDRDVAAAISAYESILENDLVEKGRADSWGAATRMDYRRLMVQNEMALARLFFIRLQDNAGVTYFRSGLRRHDLMFNRFREAAISNARRLYHSIENDRFEVKCAELVDSVAEEGVVWYGDVVLGDTLLAIPVYLVRMSIDRSDGVADSVYVELADRLYSRIIRTWPDSLVAQKARLARADVRVLEGQYEKAIPDIDAVLRAGHFKMASGEISLFKSEILAHGLNRYEEAMAVFDSVITEGPDSRLGRTAALDKASVLLMTGREEEGIRILKDLELDREVPPEISTTAMFIRAMQLKSIGEIGEAKHLMWRICRLYPFTRASFVAPLEILRFRLEERNRELAWRAHSRVVEFYEEAIAKNSASVRYRHMLGDCMLESYMMMDAVPDAALDMEELADRLRGEKRTIGYLKTALIYLNLLEDRENGVRMLKKCLDDRPQSRYATEVQGLLRWAAAQAEIQ